MNPSVASSVTSAPLVPSLLASLLALVPVVGSALVWVPAVLYRLVQGNHGHARLLGICSVVLVGTVDHVIRPLARGAGRGAPGVTA